MNQRAKLSCHHQISLHMNLMFHLDYSHTKRGERKMYQHSSYLSHSWLGLSSWTFFSALFLLRYDDVYCRNVKKFNYRRFCGRQFKRCPVISSTTRGGIKWSSLTPVVVLIDSFQPPDVIVCVCDEMNVQHIGLRLRTRLKRSRLEKNDLVEQLSTNTSINLINFWDM